MYVCNPVTEEAKVMTETTAATPEKKRTACNIKKEIEIFGRSQEQHRLDLSHYLQNETMKENGKRLRPLLLDFL